ncbi:MAG: hypothetical protein SGJ04_01930 [Bacteroidota bacterium]|nr:hypothetical protein [Bacteroidota bacterium]
MKYIFYFILALLVIRVVGSWFRFWIKRATVSGNNQTGKTTVNAQPQVKPTIKGGEYIDYTEVK